MPIFRNAGFATIFKLLLLASSQLTIEEHDIMPIFRNAVFATIFKLLILVSSQLAP